MATACIREQSGGQGRLFPEPHPLLKTAWAKAESLIHSNQCSLALPLGPWRSAWILALK